MGTKTDKIDMSIGDSQNLYHNANYLEGRSVPELIAKVKEIRIPIKILDWVTHGTRVYVIFITDFPVKKVVRKRSK